MKEVELSHLLGAPSPERQYIRLCEIKDVVPGKQLPYSWRFQGYSGDSDSPVTFALIAQGEKTPLKFSRTGIDTFPAENPDLAAENFAEDGGSFRTFVHFLEEGGKTRVSMRGVFKTVEYRQMVIDKYGALEGQTQHIARMDNYLKQIKSREISK